MPSLAIIGGGFSGTLVAVHLMRHAPPDTAIVLIERQGAPGRGVAYSTDCRQHLLNVPAQRMSAFPDQPEHFLAWARSHAGEEGFPARIDPGDFLPRHIYGDYLAAVLKEARRNVPAGVAFESVIGEAVGIEEREGAPRILFADGRHCDASQVVLAIGNLPGEYPIRKPLTFYRGARYVHVPWQSGTFEGIGKEDDVLLVGAGLTSADLAVQLSQIGHRGVIHALSRRGLKPQRHLPGLPAYPPFLQDEPPHRTIRSLMRRVRQELARAAASGWDWRPVIDSIRPFAQRLWQDLPWEERARFLRHVRPHWEICRHRIAPALADILTRLEAEGRLKFYAGRLESLTELEAGVGVRYRRRGEAEVVALPRVAKVINCTGPRSDYSKFQHPLLVDLLASRFIDHDPLALGIQTLPNGEVLRYRGGPVGWLHTLGAPMKGLLWESTSVPELRVQAQRLAGQLLFRLKTAEPQIPAVP